MTPARRDSGRGTERARTLGAAGAAAAGTGGVLLALAGTACCTGPGIAALVVSVLGVGGAAWAAGLQPYSPYLSAVSLVFIALGFWATRRRRGGCDGESRAARISRRIVRILLGVATLVWIATVVVLLRSASF